MYTVIQRRTVFLTRSDLACVMPFIYFKQLLVLNKQVSFSSWLIISFYPIIFFHFRHTMLPNRLFALGIHVLN